MKKLNINLSIYNSYIQVLNDSIHVYVYGKKCYGCMVCEKIKINITTVYHIPLREEAVPLALTAVNMLLFDFYFFFIKR